MTHDELQAQASEVQRQIDAINKQLNAITYGGASGDVDALKKERATLQQQRDALNAALNGMEQPGAVLSGLQRISEGITDAAVGAANAAREGVQVVASGVSKLLLPVAVVAVVALLLYAVVQRGYATRR